ncbi:hypothetical protein LINGRAHAP2_LOCUS12459 [Linum grandiflorum]
MANLGHTLEFGTHLIPPSNNHISQWLFYDSIGRFEPRLVVAG